MINDFNKTIIDYFDIDMFVETGTYCGETISTLNKWDYKKAIEVADIVEEYCRTSAFINILTHSKIYDFKYMPNQGYPLALVYDIIDLSGFLDDPTMNIVEELANLISAEKKVWNFHELLNKAIFKAARTTQGNAFIDVPLNFKNCNIFKSDSKDMIKKRASKHYRDKNCLFFLDAHSDGNYPLLGELENIKQIANSKPIVAIDDFFVPGQSKSGPGGEYGYDMFGEDICGGLYIRDSIKDVTDTVYCCPEQNAHRRGCGVVFFNRNRQDLQDFLSKYPMIEIKI
jgi:hypothetical protein